MLKLYTTRLIRWFYWRWNDGYISDWVFEHYVQIKARRALRDVKRKAREIEKRKNG